MLDFREPTEMDIPNDVIVEIGPRSFTRFELAAVHNYWLSKLRGRQMPSREDIVPGELTPQLHQILLADVLDDGRDFRYRLLGTRLTRYFPERATGKTFTEALAPFGAASVAGTISVYRKIVKTRQPALIKGPGEYYHQDAKTFEAVLMPLSNDDLRVTMVLGAFEFELRKRSNRAWKFGPDRSPLLDI